MAVVKTRWSSPIKKEEKVKPVAPKKEKKIIIPKVEEEQVAMPITEETTAEEIIANLPKKQRGKKVVKVIEE